MRSLSRETKSVAWGIVSAVIGVFALSAFIGTLIYGILYGIALAIPSTLVTFIVLKATEKKWAPWLASVFSGHP
jgi:uncharacterized membrane protein YoaK (UPF0700 family)